MSLFFSPACLLLANVLVLGVCEVAKRLAPRISRARESRRIRLAAEAADRERLRLEWERIGARMIAASKQSGYRAPATDGLSLKPTRKADVFEVTREDESR